MVVAHHLHLWDHTFSVLGTIPFVSSQCKPDAVKVSDSMHEHRDSSFGCSERRHQMSRPQTTVLAYDVCATVVTLRR